MGVGKNLVGPCTPGPDSGHQLENPDSNFSRVSTLFLRLRLCYLFIIIALRISLKLAFELLIIVHFPLAHIFSFAAYQPSNLTNHITSWEPVLTDLLG